MADRSPTLPCSRDGERAKLTAMAISRSISGPGIRSRFSLSGRQVHGARERGAATAGLRQPWKGNVQMTICHRKDAAVAMSSPVRGLWQSALLIVLLMCPIGEASAQLVLSQVIVDLQPGKRDREDIEIFNNSPDRA